MKSWTLAFARVTALLWLLPLQLHANPAEQLQSLLEPIRSLSADFEQSIQADDGYVIQETQGHLMLARPGKLNWASKAPFEQRVIGDGETLWIYDPDLEQVTIRPFLQDIAKTPAILLIGEMAGLQDDYEVSLSTEASSEEIKTYSLSPKNDGGLYQQLLLAFAGEVPVHMTLVDALGQRTEIRFLNVIINPQVQPGQFTFTIPDGVDVLRDG